MSLLIRKRAGGVGIKIIFSYNVDELKKEREINYDGFN